MLSPITVKHLTPPEYGRWDRFVTACAQATFFHRSGWQTVIEEVFHHRTWFLYAEQAGEICGVLPLAQVKSWLFGNSIASLPFCVYGGVAATVPDALPALEAEAERLATK